MSKPARRPANPFFSSGPCKKRPGWTPQTLSGALTGRSHRSLEGRARLKSVIDRTKALLKLPAGYEVAIVPGSDTGAFEMAMWNLLGPRGVDVFSWDVFGRIWLKDALDELKLRDVRTFDADWGKLPDLQQARFDRDVVFTWNGTTSGVSLEDANWISAKRTGLTLCDATSALFATPIDFEKIDALSFSWQKVLGGEAGHGMLILSPRAFERLETYSPPWPVPKVLRLKSGGRVLRDAFEGVTINTPSMLCVEDYADALSWVDGIGGLDEMIARARKNSAIIHAWASQSSWLELLARDPATRSSTTVCLKFCAPNVVSEDDRLSAMKAIVDLLEHEGVAFDINAYRGVPAGLRIWTGATIEADDLSCLTEWLDWAYSEVCVRRSK